jgi:hypothetical protein
MSKIMGATWMGNGVPIPDPPQMRTYRPGMAYIQLSARKRDGGPTTYQVRWREGGG